MASSTDPLQPASGRAGDEGAALAPSCSATVLSDLRSLWRLPDFRKLFVTRLTSQLGDGMFQVGLASLFFFSATTSSKGVTVTQVAAAFAVMLLPFTIVGPWAGVLLDRWRRRQVLVVANLLRTAVAVVLAILMVTTGPGPAVYVLALVALSVNRFLLAAFSASLPRVVDRDFLLTANSIVPTAGSIAAGVGGGVGLLTRLLPAGSARDAAALGLSGVAFCAAALLATRLTVAQLGPERPMSRGELRSELTRTGRELVAGARYLIARRTPAQGLGVIFVTRFLYGMVFIAGILVCRNLFSDPSDASAGLAKFSAVLAATGVGFGLAVVLTPTLSRYTGAQQWITWCLALGAAAQLLITIRLTFTTMLVGAVLLGLAAQGAKIAVDTIVQRDTDDAYRGRAFALYDVLYNAGFVGSAALAAVVLPDDGHSEAVFGALAVVYVALALTFGLKGARTPSPVPARLT